MEPFNMASDTAAETQRMSRRWPKIDGFGPHGEVRGWQRQKMK